MLLKNKQILARVSLFLQGETSVCRKRFVTVISSYHFGACSNLRQRQTDAMSAKGSFRPLHRLRNFFYFHTIFILLLDFKTSLILFFFVLITWYIGRDGP